jgi:predicted methyltransferase
MRPWSPRLRRIAAALLAALLVASASPPALAREASVSPGINAPFETPEVSGWIEAFESEGREIWDRREAIVAALELKPGIAVADIGAGTGFFVRLIAREVGPTGRVYAVDIAREFVEAILRRSERDGQGQIQGVVNPPDRTGLPAASVDLVFSSDTYHHFEYPASMLASIRQALRPGGQLVIVDFERIPGVSSPWILAHVRADKATVIREVEAAGFRLLGEIPLLRQNYMLRFQRAD